MGGGRVRVKGGEGERIRVLQQSLLGTWSEEEDVLGLERYIRGWIYLGKADLITKGSLLVC